MTEQVRSKQIRSDDAPQIDAELVRAPEHDAEAEAAKAEKTAEEARESAFRFQSLANRVATAGGQVGPKPELKSEGGIKDGRITVKKEVDVGGVKSTGMRKFGNNRDGAIDVFREEPTGKDPATKLGKAFAKAKLDKTVHFGHEDTGLQKKFGSEEGVASLALTLGRSKSDGVATAKIEGGRAELNVSGVASATVLDVEGHLRIGSKDVGVQAAGRAYVGGESKFDGTVVIDPKNNVYAAKVGGEVFAGARAGGELKAGFGKYGSASVGGDAMAGIGVIGKSEMGLKGGKLRIKGEIGAVVALGFKAKVDIDVDAGAMYKDARGAVIGGAKATAALVTGGVEKALQTQTGQAVKSAVADGLKSAEGMAKKAMASTAGKAAMGAAATAVETVSGCFDKISGYFSSGSKTAGATAANIGQNTRAALAA